MPTRGPQPIPWPLSSFPGANPQESAGRLVNVYAEPLGEGGPAAAAWHRSAGLTLHAITGQTGYRGGLLVASLGYELFNGQALTIDANGVVVSLLGPMPGTKGVSIARNNAASPNVIAVDLDNGAYRLDGGATPYTGGGVLPQPKAVCFQDGYLFFGIADRRVFATALNSLAMNALTFTSVQAKSSDILMRVIPYGGLLFVFCSSSTEVWKDTAEPAPGFPYSRMVVLEYGLAQENAIAGYEDGFSILMWVAQDYGVWQLMPGSFQPTKISPPDLDRLIQTAIKAGILLDARAYIVSGRKFWCISSPTWSWEFNTSTNKWNERASLQPSTGLFGRWRSKFGHPAFGKWLTGDTLSGNILFTDESNFTENNAVLLARMESGPVSDFPNRMRIARADFGFVTGVGRTANTLTMAVTGAVAGTGGVVRLTVNSTVGVVNGDTLVVSNVLGTTEANGAFAATVVDAAHVELQNSVFVHAYTSGGSVVDVTAPPNMVNPTVALSVSRDGGNTYGNPWRRSLGLQGKPLQRVTVLNAGFSAAKGDRWRWDVTDQVYVGFTGATQSTEAHEY